MARVRISTTVDERLLAAAREARAGVTDAALVDEALGALLARHRAAEIDAAYAAYDRLPLEVADEWATSRSASSFACSKTMTGTWSGNGEAISSTNIRASPAR